MENAPRILVVDDEQDLREILSFNLSSEGFEIESVASAEDALRLDLESFDLILLDVMMGGMTGYRLADIIRKERRLEVPVIFLTARGTENDLVTGFNVGGDDYIRKPFSIKEVIVRIRAVLKRGDLESKKKKPLIHHGLLLNPDSKTATIDRNEIELTRKEFKILALLMKNKGKYISRKNILEKVWSHDVVVTDRNVDVTITRLRKKIGPYGDHLKGKTGYGYCFKDS